MPLLCNDEEPAECEVVQRPAIMESRVPHSLLKRPILARNSHLIHFHRSDSKWGGHEPESHPSLVRQGSRYYPPVTTLYAASDGTPAVPAPEQTWGLKGRQPDGTARSRALKPECILPQTTTAEAGEPMRGKASAAYVGTLDDRRETGHPAASRNPGPRHPTALTTVHPGDGSAWIRENARLTLPRKHRDPGILPRQRTHRRLCQIGRGARGHRPAEPR